VLHGGRDGGRQACAEREVAALDRQHVQPRREATQRAGQLDGVGHAEGVRGGAKMRGGQRRGARVEAMDRAGRSG